MNLIIGVLIFCLPLFIIPYSIRIIKPTHRGVVERFGKYLRILQPGLNFVIPIIDVVRYRNITERLADVQPQDIITKDNLNARVDLQVYYKVVNTEDAIKASYYNVDDFKLQIIALAQTTARNVIGDMRFIEVNSQRNELNKKLAEIMEKEILNWGVAVVRVELKEITPPESVQETMNAVIQAQNQKEAAIDIATAKETEADGLRRAEIKKADGIKQARILRAQGEAEAIELVNKAAEKFFIGNAKELKQLETLENSMSQNTKYVLSSDLLEKISKVLGR